jgi:universal stress protein A
MKLREQSAGSKPAQEARTSRPSAGNGVRYPADHIQLVRIVVPTDFSEESQKAFTYAKALAARFDASIELVFVVEPASFVSGLDQSIVTVSNEEAASAAEKRLVRLAQEIEGEDLRVFPKVRIGKPYLEICTLAREYNADLIVIGTHGHTGIKHTFLGSVAERVVRHAPCPVLVVRQNEHEFLTLQKGLT